MKVQPGIRLGPYEITAAIGAGGMGEVFRARDTKLNRDVAIKVLPEAFADDHERLARFTREAQTLAALNHPNIAAIYGVEDVPVSRHSGSASGAATRALVMELVPGEDLSAHIARGPIPIAEALPIARQIVDALEAAHEQGIVHRDLKPANVKVRVDGTVKILDFGLAKAMDPSGASSNPNVSHSPTLTHQGTAVGMIIGTAAYMSPEQARGKRVDKRADIWAFGVVLYEMVTGRPLFHTETVSDTIAAVLRGDIDVATLPASTPPAIRGLVARCLDRDPKTRLRDIGEARVILQTVDTGETGDGASANQSVVQRPGSVVSAALVGGGLVVGLLIGWNVWPTLTSNLSGTPVHLQMSLRPASVLTGSPGNYGRPYVAGFTVTPNGSGVVFAAQVSDTSALYWRAFGAGTATLVPGTEGATTPFMSPDGIWVGFVAHHQIKRVRLPAGPVDVLCDLPAPGPGVIYGATWLEDDRIVFGGWEGALWVVASGGGNPTPLTTVEAEREASHRLPVALPGGRKILFTSAKTGASARTVEAFNLDSGKRVVLVPGASDGRFVAPGLLVFVRDGALMGVRFDPSRLTIEGDPVRLVEGIATAEHAEALLARTGVGLFEISRSGTLVFAEAGQLVNADSRARTVSLSGQLPDFSLPDGDYARPRFSPDGKSLAIGRRGGVVTIDLESGATRPLLNLPRGFGPLWAPDSQALLLAAAGGVTRVTVDGTTEPTVVVPGNFMPSSMTADGEWLFLNHRPSAAASDVWVQRKGGQPRAVVATDAVEQSPEISPDGRWLAYQSNEAGQDEIYIQAFPGPGPRRQVSVGGGEAPRWRPDGRALLFLQRDEGSGSKRLVSVGINDDGSVAGGSRRVIATGAFRTLFGLSSWDIHPDGKRALLIEGGGGQPEPVTSLEVVVNWVDQIRARISPERDEGPRP